jgi:protein-disulfide isomerase
MENNEKWVQDRLSSLEPPAAWKPDEAAALRKIQVRDQAYRKHRTQWLWSGMAAAIVCLAIFLTPARCAFGVCRTTNGAAPAAVTEPEPQPASAAPPAGVAAAPAPPPQSSVPVPPSYKETGNANAPIVCELFTDYQCPHCATVFDQVVPMLRAEYVLPGKVRFVHRDYPLSMHAYARLAARYANAAGTLGQYELVVNQIFRTQPVWSQSGDVDALVAQVLDPATMEKVRDLVRSDGHLDDTVTADTALAQRDGLNQTPTLVVTHNGKRQVLAPVPPYSLLKSYLDELLTK